MPQRILFYHYGDASIRGSEIALINLLSRIDRDRFEPIVACNQPITADEVKKVCDAETFVVPIPEVSVDGWKVHGLPAWVRATLHLRQLVREQRIDLIYCNSGLPMQTARSVSTATGIPAIVHVHCEYTRRYVVLYRIRRAESVIFGCRSTRDEAARRFAFDGNLDVVYYGVDTERFRPIARGNASLRASLGIGPEKVVIGQVASLIRRKGVDALLAAFARLHPKHADSHLVIVGDGPQEGALRELAAALGIADHVSFPGACDGAAEYHQRVFDIHAVPSRSESLPLSAIEASACGLSQVGTDVAGISEIIRDGESGYIIDVDDTAALADRLERLVSDPAKREAFGARARRHVLDQFTIEGYARGIEDVIDRQLDR